MRSAHDVATVRSAEAALMATVPEGELNPASREALEYAQYQGSGTNPLTKDTWG